MNRRTTGRRRPPPYALAQACDFPPRFQRKPALHRAGGSRALLPPTRGARSKGCIPESRSETLSKAAPRAACHYRAWRTRSDRGGWSSSMLRRRTRAQTTDRTRLEARASLAFLFALAPCPGWYRLPLLIVLSLQRARMPRFFTGRPEAVLQQVRRCQCGSRATSNPLPTRSPSRNWSSGDRGWIPPDADRGLQVRVPGSGWRVNALARSCRPWSGVP